MAGRLVKRKNMATRDEALALLFEHTPSDSLRRHCLAVEAGVRWYARKAGADELLWGNAALLHDFDYEQHPDEHPLWGMALLEKMGYEPELIRAIGSHYSAKTGIPVESPLERTLYACDEMSGFITACVYVRPSKSVMDLEPKSVLKKMKEKSFAAAVPREDLTLGTELLGLPLDEHIGNLIAAFRENPGPLGMG